MVIYTTQNALDYLRHRTTCLPAGSPDSDFAPDTVCATLHGIRVYLVSGTCTYAVFHNRGGVYRPPSELLDAGPALGTIGDEIPAENWIPTDVTGRTLTLFFHFLARFDQIAASAKVIGLPERAYHAFTVQSTLRYRVAYVVRLYAVGIARIA